MSSGEVPAQRYPEVKETGLGAAGPADTGSGNLEGDERPVTRRCTECGRRGHYATNPLYHPATVQAVRL